MASFGAFKVLWQKELDCVLGNKSLIISSFGFSLLLVVVASFSFRQLGYGQPELLSMTPGVVWLICLFVGVIVLNHTFVAECEDNALHGVVLSGAKPELIFAAKCLLNLCFIFAVQLATVFLHVVFFGVDVSFSQLFSMLVVCFLGVAGLASLGTLFSYVSVLSTAREILLPVLLFPLLIPLSAGVVSVSRQSLEMGALAAGDFWFMFLCIYDIIAFAISILLFERLVRV